MGAAWRYAALGGAVAGLAAAPPLEPGLPPWPFAPVATLTLIAAPVAALARSRPAAARPCIRSWLWLAAVAALAAASGLTGGVERVRAIDGGAFAGELGSRVEVRGFVAGVPRPADGIVVVPVATADGLLAIEAPLPERELGIGMQVRARGTVREPEPWRAGRLAIAGMKRLVAARRVDSTGTTRGGVAGLVDGVRERSEAALERAMPPAEAALARGFVLGQDDRIDDATTRDFRRSGLAHLLAVSGQNVLLLALLAIPILALLGLSLRGRLIVVIALIALYVPVTGAGPSIQRAAVMGAVGIVALLAGRASRRWYAVLLAAALTLAVNPRAGADVGWQLSFAAVIGIVLWSRPVSGLVLWALSRQWRRPDAARPATASVDRRSEPAHAVEPPSPLDLRRGLAEGAAMTITATLATAPVSAFHFELVSIAALPANLLALPAVAPIMWLGMLSAALGQLPSIPVEPLNRLCALLVAYVAQVAAWFGDPAWATLELSPPPLALLAALGAACFLAALLVAAAGRRRSRLSVAPGRIRPPDQRSRCSQPSSPSLPSSPPNGARAPPIPARRPAPRSSRSPSSTSARATRSSSTPSPAARCWSTRDRRGPIW